MATVIIDGSGDEKWNKDDKRYKERMAGSFCRQLADQLHASATYHRGPTVTGKEVPDIVEAALRDVLRYGKKDVVLIGYSRGACAALNVAKRLQRKGKKVSSVFLFDAVDMSMAAAGFVQTMPDNIEYVAHVRAARDLKFWLKNPVQSRFYFISTGRWLAGNGKHEDMTFVGTHGAIGGVPSADVVGDDRCAESVADWMNRRLRERGIRAKLTYSRREAAKKP